MKRKTFIITLNLALFVLTIVSCSPNSESVDEPDNMIYYRDISYGKSSAQQLDMLYPDYPKNISNTINVMLFIHGGGWSSGDKSVYNDAIKNIAENFGMLAVTMNYRMFDEDANCDDMLADIQSALTIIKTHATNRKVNIGKVILMGASAGGHLSLLYSYKCHENSPIPIALCVSQCGPTDFTDPFFLDSDNTSVNLVHASRLAGTLITRDNYNEKTNALLSISPINYVSNGIPPTLFAHGILDALVPVSNAYRLKEALDSCGAVSDLYIFSQSGHELDKDPEMEQAFFTRLMEYIYSIKQ